MEVCLGPSHCHHGLLLVREVASTTRRLAGLFISLSIHINARAQGFPSEYCSVERQSLTQCCTLGWRWWGRRCRIWTGRERVRSRTRCWGGESGSAQRRGERVWYLAQVRRHSERGSFRNQRTSEDPSQNQRRGRAPGTWGIHTRKPLNKVEKKVISSAISGLKHQVSWCSISIKALVTVDSFIYCVPQEPEWDVSSAFFANAASHIRPKGSSRKSKENKENEARREVNKRKSKMSRSFIRTAVPKSVFRKSELWTTESVLTVFVVFVGWLFFFLSPNMPN